MLHVCARAHVHTHTHPRTHARTHTRTHARTHARTHTHTTHTHTHTHTHTQRIHTHTHTHTQTHTHTHNAYTQPHNHTPTDKPYSDLLRVDLMTLLMKRVGEGRAEQSRLPRAMFLRGRAGIAQWLKRRTRDRKVPGLSPGRSGGRIFFSRVNFLC